MAYKRTIKEKILDDALLGFIRGTEAVHSLPSYLVTLSDQRDQDETVGRTKFKKIPYKIIESLTIAGEIVAYAYAASNGVPACLAPLFTNYFDVLGYFNDKIEEDRIREPGEEINWKEGAFWEQMFEGLYRDNSL